MDLTERKQINNGSWLSRNLYMPKGGEGWGNVATGAASFATNAINAFGPTKTASTMMNDAGTSTGYGPGFTYQRQNSVNSAQQMDELSKENTTNTLKTATAGATLGASFGPIGAGIGFLGGGILGLIGGGARKRELLNQIKTAKLNTNAFNDYSFASGQSDFLTQDYNTRYDNSQDDLIYQAKDGKMPNVKLAKGLEPNAMVSNGEIIGHVDNQGNVIDVMRVGIGKDNKDTIPVHLAGGKEPSDNSFVITNKGGISDYVAATGDVKGGLQMQKQMKEYQRYKQLWNGKLPGFAKGQLPRLPWFVASEDPKPGELGETQSVIGLMPEHPNEWKNYQDKIVGSLSDDRSFAPYKPTDDTGIGSKRSSWVLPAALSALGIATAYGMRSKGQPYTSDTYVGNPYEQQIRSTMARRRPNILNQIDAVRDAEARGRYTARNMGTSIGAYLPMMVAQNIGAQKNIANVLAAGDNLRNQYLNEQATMDAKLGGDIASRRMNSNQFRDSRYDRAASMKYTLDNNAYAQMLGQAQYGYKNIFDLNKWLDTMGLYNQDYALRADEMRRRYLS